MSDRMVPRIGLGMGLELVIEEARTSIDYILCIPL